ncbi:DeoR/GlpR transcriptional regulator [Solirubrobacter sp. CPCC 204708]|uniref:DeoR/GlpR family DNA-binding transcription regulator n=1 Tax=Solirubrobacter deserti TaxID=2282478 RepID=A0ABT4RJZ9_9ACTN|nr:DeoR/GlpR family DNA-binding transcription regulator [Solirubrobacter deserti]MBE2317645.1 DeoR/GlpR transcriptional regulator [Solirubrobacter deserti]MDA0138595.1 DeoR/GlpR family DNA-binding transcription regulator [Solirubrobacter deserti]
MGETNGRLRSAAVTATALAGGGRSPLLSEERRRLIAEQLQAAGAVTITEVQARFGVSPMTARRDLTVLAERGVARRTHGGAVLPSLAATENSFAQRLRDAPEAKTRLAEAAFALLTPGETVFLDASSTTYFLARLIAQRALPLRVITNSLPVLQELSGAEQAEVIAIGGTFRRLTCSYVGPAAVRAARDHFADRLLMSITGITATGVMTDADVLEAEIKRTMLAQAEQSVLLLDDSKLSARGRQAVAPVARVSLVLVDGLARTDAARLSDLGALVLGTRQSL